MRSRKALLTKKKKRVVKKKRIGKKRGRRINITRKSMVTRKKRGLEIEKIENHKTVIHLKHPRKDPIYL